MDQIFRNIDLTVHTLGAYLRTGFVPKEESRQLARVILEIYGVLPTRGTPANCPDCGAQLRTTTDSQRHGFRYECRNHGRKRYSPYQNTFITNVRTNEKMGEDNILYLLLDWLIKMPLSIAIENIGISRDTAVFWYGFCRDAACAIAWHEYEPIGGPNDIVEVDETHLFKRKFQVGRLNEWRHVWVVGGISRTTKKRFAVTVYRRDIDTLTDILGESVDHDSYICSDYWRGYNDCNEVFNGHGRVNHSQNFLDPPKEEPPHWAPPGRFDEKCLDSNWNEPPPQPGMQPYRNHTQTIERCWRDLKEYLRTTNNVKTADQYIGAWMYRRNILDRLESTKAKMERFLRDLARVYPGVGKKSMKLTREEIYDCDCHECAP